MIRTIPTRNVACGPMRASVAPTWSILSICSILPWLFVGRDLGEPCKSRGKARLRYQDTAARPRSQKTPVGRVRTLAPNQRKEMDMNDAYLSLWQPAALLVVWLGRVLRLPQLLAASPNRTVTATSAPVPACGHSDRHSETACKLFGTPHSAPAVKPRTPQEGAEAKNTPCKAQTLAPTEEKENEHERRLTEAVVCLDSALFQEHNPDRGRSLCALGTVGNQSCAQAFGVIL